MRTIKTKVENNTVTEIQSRVTCIYLLMDD